ncbi:MAG TPA: enolase C-terminal domain-like protein, partial [Anaerolineales bacterium]
MSRIVEIYVTSLRIPLRRPHNTALGPTTHQENTLLRVTTDEGLHGWGEVPFGKGHNQQGETSGTARAVLRDMLIPAILGRDPLCIEENQRLLNRAVPGNLRAKSALNTAFYDLAGKILRTPTYNLLGGQCRESVLLSWSIPFLDEETAVREAQERIGLGWRMLKVKLGRGDWKEDVRMVRLIREAVGPTIKLRTDANQAYDVSTAIRVGHALAEQDVEYFEQPVARWDLQGLAQVREAIEIPIMADESVKTAQD